MISKITKKELLVPLLICLSSCSKSNWVGSKDEPKLSYGSSSPSLVSFTASTSYSSPFKIGTGNYIEGKSTWIFSNDSPRDEMVSISIPDQVFIVSWNDHDFMGWNLPEDMKNKEFVLKPGEKKSFSFSFSGKSPNQFLQTETIAVAALVNGQTRLLVTKSKPESGVGSERQ